MIQDPWQQLAQRMVPQGLLEKNELKINFTPKIMK
jgi:hypothetical protein